MAATFNLSSLIWFALTLVFTFAETNNNGGRFTADLVHRDSPLSPFYDPLESHFDRLHNAFRRSISRMNYLKTIFSPSSSGPAKLLQAPLVPTGGEYLMNISIGTPPVVLIGIADTGSDLTWIQCKPCKECYKQKPPLFDPKKSSTYKILTCESRYCSALDDGKRCESHMNLCGYSYSYGDNSFTEGSLAVENLAMGDSTSGSPVTLPNIVFGCGHDNGGTFDENGSGIIGLGGGSLSLISQLSSSIKGKFTYCLAPISSSATSKIKFGAPSFNGSSPGLISTPLIDKAPATYYYVTLEAISVGNKKLPYTNSLKTDYDFVEVEEGNMIVDSGTTLTFIESQFYDKLATVLEKEIGSQRVSDPKGVFGACFRVKSKNEDHLPVITVHFSGNADLKLQPLNAFIRVEEDLVCFTMVPSDSIAIFGNLAQMNFLVGFDLEGKTVSFMPNDCSKQ
ncbi:probable aspartic protease At2g35615 [Mangifera indica]|uniref:probable aspartic protease At2g35615 n=1 Tax=Mangifera indica TaxID=29780 RepID=UPI001CFBD696|nr:probable aspartic protease At2g35615 [Mangifera indica]